MPGTRATSFPERQRQTQTLPRRHSFHLVGTMDKLNAKSTPCKAAVEIKTTESSENTEATVGCATTPEVFLEKEGL